MGWVPNSAGGVEYAYVLNGDDSDHTLPSSKETVPSCIIICKQPVYTVYGPDGNKMTLGGWSRVFHSQTTWKVLNARVQIVRYYAASSVRVALGIDLPTLESPIPPPGLDFNSSTPEYSATRYNVYGTEGAPYTQELRPEMEIEVWMGYISNFENPSNYITKSSSGYILEPSKFTKVFTGVIDTVDLKLGRGETPTDGVNCIITARDRMRFLIDNKIFGGITVPGQDFKTGINRTTIVTQLITQGSAGACKPANGLLFHESGRPPMRLFNDTGVAKEHTTILANGSSPFTLLDQFPVDAVRWFSTIEPIPREFYCDQYTGDIAWSCRMRGEPYKLTKDSSLFSTTTAAAAVPDQLLDGLATAIYRVNRNLLSPSDLTTGLSFFTKGKFVTHVYKSKKLIEKEDAVEYARHIIELFQRSDTPKFLDPVTFCALIELESSWHQLNADGSVNTSPDKAVGLSQIIESTAVTNSLDFKKLKDDPLYNLEGGYKVLVSKARMPLRVGGSVEGLYNSGFLDAHDALMLTMSLYVGAGGPVPGSKVPQLLEVLYEKLKKSGGKVYFTDIINDPRITDPETKSYALKVINIRDRATPLIWAPIYQGWLRGSTGTVVTTAVSSSSDEIGVLRGDDNPWILSYKQSITAGGKTFKPSILSAHSGWSTLSMTTRFTLVTPQQNDSAGGQASIKSSQSLFGKPLGSSKGLTYEQAMSLTSSSYAGSGGATSPSAAKDEDIFTEEAPAVTAADISNPALLGPTVAQPLKFLSKIRLPIRNRFVWDETSDENMTQNGIDLILNAMLNTAGKDLHTIDFIVPLNPDMRPSHMVNIYNTGFFDNHKLRLEGVIHMFSSGGVQNGCITMGVAVDPQGSLDPREIPAYIEKILSEQGSAVGATSSDSVNTPNVNPTDDLNNIDVDILGQPITVKDINKADHIKKIREELENLKGKLSSADFETINSAVEDLCKAYEVFTYQYLCWTLAEPVKGFSEPLVKSETTSYGKFNFNYGIDYIAGVNNLYIKANTVSAKVQDISKSITSPTNTAISGLTYLSKLNNQPLQDLFIGNGLSIFNEVMDLNREAIRARNKYEYIPPRMVWPFDPVNLTDTGSVVGKIIGGIGGFTFGGSVGLIAFVPMALAAGGEAAVAIAIFVLVFLAPTVLGGFAGDLVGQLVDYISSMSTDLIKKNYKTIFEQTLEKIKEDVVSNLEDRAEGFLYQDDDFIFIKYYLCIIQRAQIAALTKKYPSLVTQLQDTDTYLIQQSVPLKPQLENLLKTKFPSTRKPAVKFEPTTIPGRAERPLPGT